MRYMCVKFKTGTFGALGDKVNLKVYTIQSYISKLSKAKSNYILLYEMALDLTVTLNVIRLV